MRILSVCECTHKNLTYTRSSQISSIIYHPLSIPSAPMPHSLPLQPSFLRPPWSLQRSCPIRRLLIALLQNKCMRLAVVFIHLMSDWCIACPLSQIQEGISLPRGNYVWRSTDRLRGSVWHLLVAFGYCRCTILSTGGQVGRGQFPPHPLLGSEWRYHVLSPEIQFAVFSWEFPLPFVILYFPLVSYGITYMN